MLNRSLGKLYVYLDEHDSNLKSTYELAEGENFVGGSLFCDVKLAYANIAELHCKITLTPQGEYSIEDLSNLNHGIYRVTPKNSRQKLKPNKEYELLPERPFYLTNLYKCVFKPQVHPGNAPVVSQNNSVEGIPKIFRTGSSLPAHDQEEEETVVPAPTTDRKKSIEEPVTRKEVEKPEKTSVQPQKNKKNVKKTHEGPETPKEPQGTEKVQSPPLETVITQKPTVVVPAKAEKEQTLEEERKVVAPIVEKTEKEKNLIPSERVEHPNEEDVDLKQQIKKKKPEPPKEVAKPKKEPEAVKEKVDIEPKNASPKPKKHTIQEQPPPPSKEKHEKIIKEAPPKEKKELNLVVTPPVVTTTHAREGAGQKERIEAEKEETKLQPQPHRELHPHPPLKEAVSPALKSRKEEEKLPPLHKNVLEKKPSTGTTKQAVKEEKAPVPVGSEKKETAETKAEKEADNDFEALDDYKLKKQSETALLHRQESAKKEKEKLEAEQKRSQTRHEDELDFCEDDAFEEGLVENEPEKYEPKMPRLDYRKESLEIRRRDTDEKDYGYRGDYKDRNRQFDRERDKRRDQDRDREKSREWLQDRERDFERDMERDRERGIDRRRDDRDFRLNRPRDRDDKSGRMMPRDKLNERREEGELNIIKRRKDDDYRRQDDKRDYGRYDRDDKERDSKEGRLDMKQDLRRQDSRQDYRHRDDRQLERKSSNYEENKFGRGSGYNRQHDSHRGPGQGYDNRLNIVKREKDPRDFRSDNRGNDPQSMPPKRPSMEEKPEEDKKEMDVMQNFPHYLAPFHQPAPPPRELRKDHPPPPRDMHKDSKGKDDFRSERDYDLARGKSSYENRYYESDYSKNRPPTLQRHESGSRYGTKSADKTPSEEKVQTPTPSYTATTSKTEEEPVAAVMKPEGNFELTRRKSTNESHHSHHTQEHPKVKPPSEETKQPSKPVTVEKPVVHEKPIVHEKPVVHEEPSQQNQPPSSSGSGKMESEPPAKLERDFELTRKKSNHEQRPPKVDNSKGKIAQKLEIKQMNKPVEEVSQASQQESTSHAPASHKPDAESIAKYEKQATIPKKHKPNPESTATTPAPTDGNVSGKTSATQGKTTAGKEETKEVAVAHDKGTKGRTQQYYVMFSGFDREDKEVEDCKKKLLHLGLKIVEERERTFNVLVLKKFKRTVKFLLAVIKGVDIVSFDWVKDCVDHDKIIPPSHHTFCDKAAESKFNFRLGASLQKARQMSHGFLKGYKVYFPYDIKPTYEEMKFLAESADGICIRNRPLQYRDDILIILNQGDKRNAESFSEIGFTPYSSELLFSGILQQELNFDEHKLI